MNGAGAAQGPTAPEFCARHSQYVADNPQQRRVAIDIYAVVDAVNPGREGHRDLVNIN
jgi:aspartate-semialdehyde dehydrogenase